jgi:hypothetical protein
VPGVLELPEFTTGPHVSLKFHIAVGVRGETIVYSMLGDETFVTEVGAGRA